MKMITRTTWILALVSLFADIASEMLYPVMPIYLKEVGFSILLIGVLEGIAEATAGLSKSYFGKLSDVSGRRLPFVRFGYTLSAISKPMMAMFTYPVWIFFARTVDRLGKGIRTGARDAMLSEEAVFETKGRVFGLHRAMDTLGAVIGPVTALVFLYYFPGHYRTLFIVALFPGVIAIGLTYLVRSRVESHQRINARSASLFAFARYWRESPGIYKKLVGGLLAFTLINSSDVFLLLKVREAGLDDRSVIGVYVFYNLIYALASYPLGRLSDLIGFKRTMIAGFALFALVYFGMALGHSLSLFYILFSLYGLYAAATESVAKAWISNVSDKRDTATAIGTYTGFQSISTMVASSLAGWLWITFGASVAFFFSAGVTVLIIVYFITVVPSLSHD